MRNWAPSNLLDWFEGEGEGQGDSARQPVEQTREIPQHRGGRGAKPWAGTLCSLDVKAKALKEEAEGREGTGGKSRCTRCTKNLLTDSPARDKKTLPSTPPFQVPKDAFLIPH